MKKKESSMKTERKTVAELEALEAEAASIAEKAKKVLGVGGISLRQARYNYGRSSVSHAMCAVLKLVVARMDGLPKVAAARAVGYSRWPGNKRVERMGGASIAMLAEAEKRGDL